MSFSHAIINDCFSESAAEILQILSTVSI